MTGWVVMALAAAALTRTRASVTGARLLVLPTVCAVAWAVAHHGEAWALPAGLVAASIPVIAGLLPRDDKPNLTLAGMGTVAWVATVLATVGASIPMLLAMSVVPAVVAACYALVRPRPDEVRFAMVHLLVALVASVVALVEAKAFTAAMAPMDLLVTVAGLGACTMFVLARVLGGGNVDAEFDTLDLGGVVAAGFVGVALAVLAPAVVPDYVAAGRTAAIAVTGLLLVVAGLRIDRVAFRQLGLVAIAVAAGKVVVIDTAGATLAARALSFIGIGAVLILGAFAYSRAQRRNASAGATPVAAQSLGCSW